jgi:hypothetical protein
MLIILDIKHTQPIATTKTKDYANKPIKIKIKISNKTILKYYLT